MIFFLKYNVKGGNTLKKETIMIKKYALAIICLFAIVAIAPACRTTQGTSSEGNQATQTPQSDSAENVKMYLTDKPAVPFKEITRVSAYKLTLVGIPKNREDVYNVLKKEAAAKGANAIINITEDPVYIYGVAVLIGPSPSKQASSVSSAPITASSGAKENSQAVGTTQSATMLVVISTTKVKSEPKSKSKTISTLKPGAQVESLGQSGDWVNIKLSNGLTGWVSKKAVVVREGP